MNLNRLGNALILILWITPAPLAMAWPQSDNSDFSKAAEAYRQGRFDEALTGYSKLLEKYPHNPELLYNTANTYYRKQDIGQAILYYEKAKVNNPRDLDIQYNLKFVNSQLEYSVKDTRNWYLRALEYVLNLVTHSEVMLLALALYFFFVLAWVFVLYFRPDHPWGWIRKTLLISFLCSFVLVGLKGVQAYMIRDAVVVSKEAEVRFGPSSTDQVAFRLGEGLKVYVVDHHSDWSRILLANSDTGWVKNSEIAEVLQS